MFTRTGNDSDWDMWLLQTCVCMKYVACAICIIVPLFSLFLGTANLPHMGDNFRSPQFFM